MISFSIKFAQGRRNGARHDEFVISLPVGMVPRYRIKTIDMFLSVKLYHPLAPLSIITFVFRHFLCRNFEICRKHKCFRQMSVSKNPRSCHSEERSDVGISCKMFRIRRSLPKIPDHSARLPRPLTGPRNDKLDFFDSLKSAESINAFGRFGAGVFITYSRAVRRSAGRPQRRGPRRQSRRRSLRCREAGRSAGTRRRPPKPADAGGSCQTA